MILSDHFISLNIKLTAIFRIMANKYHLSYSQYCIIMKIDSIGISMSELAKNLGLDKSTLTRNISVLINRDLVIRTQSRDDLRIYNIFLSAQGENIKNTLYANLDDFTIELLQSLDNKSQDELYLLDKLIQKLDSYEIIK